MKKFILLALCVVMVGVFAGCESVPELDYKTACKDSQEKTEKDTINGLLDEFPDKNGSDFNFHHASCHEIYFNSLGEGSGSYTYKTSYTLPMEVALDYSKEISTMTMYNTCFFFEGTIVDCRLTESCTDFLGRKKCTKHKTKEERKNS